jgi:hypothetical protein
MLLCIWLDAIKKSFHWQNLGKPIQWRIFLHCRIQICDRWRMYCILLLPPSDNRLWNGIKGFASYRVWLNLRLICVVPFLHPKMLAVGCQVLDLIVGCSIPRYLLLLLIVRWRLSIADCWLSMSGVAVGGCTRSCFLDVDRCSGVSCLIDGCCCRWL